MNEVDLRCPRCGAHARGGAAWCTLCYASLRPEPEPVDGDPLGGAANGADPLGVDAMLARLAAQSDHPLAGLAGRLDSAAAKAVAIAVGLLVVLLVSFGVMFVLGSLL